MSATLLFAAGNPDRGDDAVAWLVADRLQPKVSTAIEIIKSSGYGLHLVDCLQDRQVRPERLVIIDALNDTTNQLHHRLQVIDGNTAPEIPLLRDRVTSSHGIGVLEGVEIARSLEILPPILAFFGIPGANFGAGASLSPAVRDSLDGYTDEIQAYLNATDLGE